MAALNLSELAKRDNALLVYNNIIKKTPFELNNKTEIELKFNLDVKGIATAFKTQDLKKIKELSSDKLTKMFFVDKNKKVYSYLKKQHIKTMINITGVKCYIKNTKNIIYGCKSKFF